MNGERIQAYLDGELTASELAAFERDLRSDAGLRRELLTRARDRRDLRRSVQERCGAPRGGDGVAAGVMRLMADLRRGDLAEAECRRLEAWLASDRELQSALARHGGFERELHDAVGTRALAELVAGQGPEPQAARARAAQVRAYLAGELDELAILAFEDELLADAQLRRDLLAQAGLERALPPAVSARAQAGDAPRVLPMPRPAARAAPVRPPVAAPARVLTWAPVAVAAAVFLAVLVLGRQSARLSEGGEALDRAGPDAPVISAYGAGTRLERAGDVLPFVDGGSGGLRDGDRVAVPVGGQASLHFDDGTTVDVAGGSSLRWVGGGSGKRLALERGELVCAAAPQERRTPLRVAVPGGELEVVGTVFRGRVAADTSRVAVAAGAVRVHAEGGGEGLVLRAGEEAELRAGVWVRHQPHSPHLGITLPSLARWQGSPPVVDLALLADAWIALDDRNLDLGPDGWVARLRSDQRALLPMAMGQPLPTGVYTLRWAGHGELRVRGARQVVASEPGLLQVELAPGRSGIEVELLATERDDPLRALRVLLPGFADAAPAAVWHPDFLADCAGVGVVRVPAAALAPVAEWSARRRPDSGPGREGARGLAAEHLVALVAALDCDLWLELPAADDGAGLRELLSLLDAELPTDAGLVLDVAGATARSGPDQHELERAGVRKDYQQAVAADRHLVDRCLELVDARDDRVTSGRPSRVVLGLSGDEVGDRERLRWRDAARRVDGLAVAGGPRGRFGQELRPAALAALDRDRLLAAARAHLESRLVELEEAAALAERYRLPLFCAAAEPGFAPPPGRELPAAARERIAQLNADPALRPLMVRYLERFLELGGEQAVVALDADHARHLDPEIPAAAEWRRVPYGAPWLALRQVMGRASAAD